MFQEVIFIVAPCILEPIYYTIRMHCYIVTV